MAAQRRNSRSSEARIPLLATKLNIPPPRPRVVLRPRLMGLLDQGLSSRLVLISAPAGFGKTTLLSHWIQQRGCPAAWISLDRGDNDPVSFLSYLITALQSIQSDIGRAALSMLRSPQPRGLESVLVNLLNEILAVSDDFVLVLDDFHMLDAPAVQGLLAFVLENCPSPLHLVIATRSDPDLPLARLRSQRQLVEIRSRDLMFNTGETTQFFKAVLNLDLPAEDIDILESRTEGWVAGLQLIALLLQDRSDVSSFIQDFRSQHRFIGDYLIEEVLNRQSQTIQDFLMTTSILDRMSGPLCDAVTQRSDSHEVLQRLERDNLFLFPLDEERRWFRYHQLFADLLQQRLCRSQPALVSRLHLRASDWYAQNLLGPEAVEHALAAREYERAAHLIEEIGEIVWDYGLQSRQLEWFECFPEAQLAAWPQLGVFYAAALVGKGEYDAAQQQLEATERTLEGLGGRDTLVRPDGTCIQVEPLRQQLRGRIDTIYALLATIRGDAPRIDKYSHAALENLRADDWKWRCMAAVTSGMAHGWTGDGQLILAQKRFSESTESSLRAGNTHLEIFSRLCEASVTGMRGRPDLAAHDLQQLVHAATEKGLGRTGLAGSIHATLGGILCEFDQVEAGMAEIGQGIRLTRANHDWIWHAAAQFVRVHALRLVNDFRSMQVELEAIERLTQDHHIPPWIQHAVSAYQALIWIAQGDRDRVRGWVEERRLRPDDAVIFWREPEYQVLAWFLSRTDHPDDAHRLFRRLIKPMRTHGRIAMLIQNELLLAVSLWVHGSSSEAVVEMHKALELAAPGGYIRTFVCRGTPVAELLEAVLAQKPDGRTRKETPGFSRAYVRKLLASFKADALPPQPAVEPWEALSEREMEVLSLIAAGLSNQRIADRLFISLNTVRTHTKNIHSKLGVHSRTQAVAKAKQKGLIP